MTLPSVRNETKQEGGGDRIPQQRRGHQEAISFPRWLCSRHLSVEGEPAGEFSVPSGCLVPCSADAELHNQASDQHPCPCLGLLHAHNTARHSLSPTGSRVVSGDAAESKHPVSQSVVVYLTCRWCHLKYTRTDAVFNFCRIKAHFLFYTTFKSTKGIQSLHYFLNFNCEIIIDSQEVSKRAQSGEPLPQLPSKVTSYIT